MKTLTIVVLLLVAAVAQAQKLPKVQQDGFRAPENVQIDGKADEWERKFQVYNPATELAYTMANNQKTLYLTLMADNNDVINRMVNGGFTLTILNKEVKNSKGASFTYPVKNDDRSIVIFNLTPNRFVTFDTSPAGLESTMNKNNLRLNAFKWIKVSGIKDLDTIPIYNEYGIEAAGKFDMERKYIVELSVPLKLLRSEINTAGTFSFQIRVNGGKFLSASSVPDNVERAKTNPILARMLETDDRRTAMLNAPTDFWGEYTLAK